MGFPPVHVEHMALAHQEFEERVRSGCAYTKGSLATTLRYDYLFGVGIGETGHARWLQGRGSRGNPSRVHKQGRWAEFVGKVRFRVVSPWGFS